MVHALKSTEERERVAEGRNEDVYCMSSST